MKSLSPPAIDPAEVPEKRGSGYPEPFRARMGDRVKRRLGEALGLTRVGINLVTLAPGGQSALRHWHTLEDEFVWVLEGELVLVTDAGEQVLGPGTCAGYPAGKRDGHHFLNRGPGVARYLEMSNRVDGDNAFYPDDDIMIIEDENGMAYVRKDGRRYPA